jgi:uncharacterized protein (DUF433 family)
MIAVESVAHIYRDDHAVAWIDDTNVKVIEVVLDHLAYGWSAEAIHEQHPHLSLAQIHASLGFYYDHAAEFDAEIERQTQRVAGMQAANGVSPLQARLRAMRAER